MEKFATDPKYNNLDLLPLAGKVLSVRDLLARSAAKVKIRVQFVRPRGVEELDQATIVFELPDPPETRGELSDPYLAVVYRNGSWVLTSLFPPFP